MLRRNLAGVLPKTFSKWSSIFSLRLQTIYREANPEQKFRAVEYCGLVGIASQLQMLLGPRGVVNKGKQMVIAQGRQNISA